MNRSVFHDYFFWTAEMSAEHSQFRLCSMDYTARLSKPTKSVPLLPRDGGKIPPHTENNWDKTDNMPVLILIKISDRIEPTRSKDIS
jgi:hypothetical protein